VGPASARRSPFKGGLPDGQAAFTVMKAFRIILVALLLLAPACGGGSSIFIGDIGCGTPGSRRSSATPEIRLFRSESGSADRIIVAGLSSDVVAALRGRTMTEEQWHSILRIRVAQELSEQLPPVAGTYDVSGGEIGFTPLFGFDDGRRYRVDFMPANLPGGAGGSIPAVATEIETPKRALPPTTVVDHVYPTSDIVPENQLRLYIHFSAPMGMKGGLDYIKLLDPSGVEVKDPFLPLDAEFWNADRTRFTVFFDPGRVKRGILPNKELGRSLTEGRPYTLVVSRDWRDGESLPLKEDFRRTFRVGPPDEKPLDQQAWRVQSPEAGSRQPLAVTFPEPLDHGLLLRALGVVTTSGAAVEGQTNIESAETRWTFTPNASWKAGSYRLRVLSILEDLAGNRIGRAFEVDQFERADRQPEPEEILIPFDIR
jgi:hypothetical protein